MPKPLKKEQISPAISAEYIARLRTVIAFAAVENNGIYTNGEFLRRPGSLPVVRTIFSRPVDAMELNKKEAHHMVVTSLIKTAATKIKEDKNPVSRQTQKLFTAMGKLKAAGQMTLEKGDMGSQQVTFDGDVATQASVKEVATTILAQAKKGDQFSLLISELFDLIEKSSANANKGLGQDDMIVCIALTVGDLFGYDSGTSLEGTAVSKLLCSELFKQYSAMKTQFNAQYDLDHQALTSFIKANPKPKGNDKKAVEIAQKALKALETDGALFNDFITMYAAKNSKKKEAIALVKQAVYPPLSPLQAAQACLNNFNAKFSDKKLGDSTDKSTVLSHPTSNELEALTEGAQLSVMKQFMRDGALITNKAQDTIEKTVAELTPDEREFLTAVLDTYTTQHETSNEVRQFENSINAMFTHAGMAKASIAAVSKALTVHEARVTTVPTEPVDAAGAQISFEDFEAQLKGMYSAKSTTVDVAPPVPTEVPGEPVDAAGAQHTGDDFDVLQGALKQFAKNTTNAAPTAADRQRLFDLAKATNQAHRATQVDPMGVPSVAQTAPPAKRRPTADEKWALVRGAVVRHGYDPEKMDAKGMVPTKQKAAPALKPTTPQEQLIRKIVEEGEARQAEEAAAKLKRQTANGTVRRF